MSEVTLMLGDCLELMKALPDGSVDMILCDLPYGTTECKWDSIIPLASLWTEYGRITKPTAAIVLTAAQPFTTALIASNMTMFKYSWVWIKNRPTGAQNAKNRPMAKHEDVLVFSYAPMGHVSQLGERRMVYNPIGVTTSGAKVIKALGSRARTMGLRPNQIGREYVSQTGFPNTCLEFDKEESHFHPTQKPVALMEYLIRTYSNEGETVLDNCFGSGTTGIACVNTRRNFIGIELDADYFAIATKRIEAAQAQGVLVP